MQNMYIFATTRLPNNPVSTLIVPRTLYQMTFMNQLHIGRDRKGGLFNIIGTHDKINLNLNRTLSKICSTFLCFIRLRDETFPIYQIFCTSTRMLSDSTVMARKCPGEGGLCIRDGT